MRVLLHSSLFLSRIRSVVFQIPKLCLFLQKQKISSFRWTAQEQKQKHQIEKKTSAYEEYQFQPTKKQDIIGHIRAHTSSLTKYLLP